MNKMYLGKCVNTHGIKGEIRILSDIENKEEIFKIGHKLYILEDELIITSYRVHKGYDMVTFDGITNIDEVLKYKGNKVYFNRDEVNISNYLLNDLIGFKISFNNDFAGIIEDFMYNSTNCLLMVKNNNKTYYIPNQPHFIKKVDLDNKIVYVENIKDLM